MAEQESKYDIEELTSFVYEYTADEVEITNIYEDLDDGLILLKILDILKPDTVNWKKVEKKPNNKFKRLGNCNYAIVLCKQLKISLIGIGGSNIVDGNAEMINFLLTQLQHCAIENSINPLRKRKSSQDRMKVLKMQQEALEKAFHQYIDPDDNGDVDIQEWCLGMQKLNVQLNETQQRSVFRAMDKDKSGYIEKSDFVLFGTTGFDNQEFDLQTPILQAVAITDTYEEERIDPLSAEIDKEESIDPQQELDLIVIDYESDYMQHTETDEKQQKNICDRAAFSKQKQEIIEQYMAAKITKIQDNDCEAMVRILSEYALKTLNNHILNEYKNTIMDWFHDNEINVAKLGTMKRKEFVQNVAKDCGKEDEDMIALKRQLHNLYGMIAQYTEYEALKRKVENNQNGSCVQCQCNYRKLESFQITNRNIYSDKIVLLSEHNEKEDKYGSTASHPQQMDKQIELNTEHEEFKTMEEQLEPHNVETLEITRTHNYIYYNSKAFSHVMDGDILCEMNGECLDGLETQDVMKVIEYAPLPFILTFKRPKMRCCTWCRCCKKNKKSLKKKRKNEVRSIVLNWIIKFMKLSLNIVTKTSSMLDAVTDVILLYKAQKDDAIIFTMILFLTLLAPYILSYSSGVQIFLYRKTFQNVELFTFKSLLLGLYLFPTGIMYFILLDVVDALAELYKWFAFGVLNKIKTQHDLIKIESNIAQYFGMARMDWFSFKKQKLIAQLFFETLPQATLQVLLFSNQIPRGNLTGITDRDLMLSIGSAVFNCLIQLFRLQKESKAAQETFVQYALNCITSRHGWVPFNHLIEQFMDAEDAQNHVKTLEIDYRIQYELPLVTHLSKSLLQRNATEPLQIMYDPHNSYHELEDRMDDANAEEQEYHDMMQRGNTKKIKAAYGSIEYDFSEVTINKLITTIKALATQRLKTKQIRIRFADSLRLLNVRSILSLMRACSEKALDLDDIDSIDWTQPFENTSNAQDIRLLSNTFDVDRKSLLISVYLTGYGNKNNYSILSQIHFSLFENFSVRRF